MPTRCLPTMVLCGSALLVPMAGPVWSQAGISCRDFNSGAAAQVYFDARPGDQANLDPDNDGVACNELPATAPADVDTGAAPSRGVSSGGGGAVDRRAELPAALALSGGALVLTGVYLTTRRPSRGRHAAGR